ncbi:hypothetical protein [Selenomonas ruminantium]|uniref:Uncharacterized protein n=1 Tax=Selenomonas ruminantium TaxID=971 RepID=A0A1H0N3K1_SELRU|nr:hypothetical protein [Selenomonas ruminantium]SDO87247.1 hypothetical protein SAMN05216366_102161 [Selenomonas ruminantium]
MVVKVKRACPFCGEMEVEVYEHHAEVAGLKYAAFIPNVQFAGAG